MKQKENVINEKSINDINYELLKKQFPHAVCVDEDGKYSIDPQKLQMSLDPSKANIKEDNLDALKILRQNYFEAIKMIYIDPPYNTKNDGFVYNDNFTSSTEETLEELGYDKEYVDYIENIQGAKTHSGWLSFMYPRLLLARDLLKDDGVIFISIDDNEVAQLKLLCDDIFGGDNFISQLIWKKKAGGGSDAKYFADDHEYILTYAKNENSINRFFTKMNDKQKKEYKYKDENFDLLGLYKRKNLYQSGIDDDRPNLRYEVIAPDNTKILPPTIWRWSKETLQKEMNKNKVDIIKNSKGVWQVFTKNYMFEDDNSERLIKPRTILTDFGLTRDGNNDIKLLFTNQYFSYPKPKKLIKHLLEIITKDNDIILDFFAGSGTTAHAVMDLNAQDDLLAFTQNRVESSEDILYNLLVAESLPLSTKIKTLIEDKLHLASNVAFVLGDISINELITKLKPQKELEYITIYSPNISDDKFTLELESAVASIGIKTDKIKFRG